MFRPRFATFLRRLAGRFDGKKTFYDAFDPVPRIDAVAEAIREQTATLARHLSQANRQRGRTHTLDADPTSGTERIFLGRHMPGFFVDVTPDATAPGGARLAVVTPQGLRCRVKW